MTRVGRFLVTPKDQFLMSLDTPREEWSAGDPDDPEQTLSVPAFGYVEHQIVAAKRDMRLQKQHQFVCDSAAINHVVGWSATCGSSSAPRTRSGWVPILRT